MSTHKPATCRTCDFWLAQWPATSQSGFCLERASLHIYPRRDDTCQHWQEAKRG